MKHDHCDFCVVGTGAIAQRHVKNLKFLFDGCIVGNVSSSGKREFASFADICFGTIEEALNNTSKFGVIASPAKYHLIQASKFLKRNLPVFIEKPLFKTSVIDESILEVLKANKDIIEVGYNLRYLPALAEFKNILEDHSVVGDVHSVSSRVGQFLPDWRPHIKHEDSVSASKDLGGGVLLELSHELDYLLWLFEDFEKVFCSERNSGKLGIEVEDSIDSLIYTKKGFIINLHMNFLDRYPNRTCNVSGDKGILTLDLMKNEIILNTKQEQKVLYSNEQYDRNEMYLEEITHFKKVSELAESPRIGLDHAIEILNIIDSMRISSETSSIINIES